MYSFSTFEWFSIYVLVYVYGCHVILQQGCVMWSKLSYIIQNQSVIIMCNGSISLLTPR